MVIDKMRYNNKNGLEAGVLYCFNNHLKGENCKYCRTRIECSKEERIMETMSKELKEKANEMKCDLNHNVIMSYHLMLPLTETAFCVLLAQGEIETCIKNRGGEKTIEAIKDYKFESVKLSELNSYSIDDIHRKFHGSNIRLIMD